MSMDIKQPFVLLLGLVLLLGIGMMLVVPMPDKPIFIFSTAIMMGLATKASVSMKANAPWTSIGLFVFALIAAGLAAMHIDVSQFTDAVWEGTMSGLAGLGVALLGEAQTRNKDA